ncbi:hypothetical protein QEN19_003048 [Hanseniaspora menglaensis]
MAHSALESVPLLPGGLSSLVHPSMRPDTLSKDRTFKIFSIIWNASPLMPLLIILPIAFLVTVLKMNGILIFTTNAIACAVLSVVLGKCTEDLSEHVGPTFAAVLNATLGNVIELIVSFYALKAGQFDIVKSSMMGSIFSNLLLVTGCCFLFGGYNRIQQRFNLTAAQTMSSLMAISCASLAIPTVFVATLPTKLDESADILKISRFTSIILLIVYGLFMIFQLKTHISFFDNSEANAIVSKASEETMENPENVLGKKECCVILAITTYLVSMSADQIVDKISDVAEAGLSKSFIALILIPIIGNAAEHVTSVFVAMNDKMDLALNISIGSSIQIALFCTPLLVIIGWIIGQPMTLQFTIFETVTLFISIFLNGYFIGDGESNWLEGVLGVALYLLIAIAFFFYPDAASVSA